MTRLPTVDEMLAEARAGVWPSPHHEPRIHWHAARDLAMWLRMELCRHDCSPEVGSNPEAARLCHDARNFMEDAHAALVLMCHRLDEAEERRHAA